MILSAKMMFEWLGEKYSDHECHSAAIAIEDAVAKTLFKGITIPDFGGNAKTLEMAQAMAKEIKKQSNIGGR
jgi:3-isopropylmalate dehydrogenase